MIRLDIVLTAIFGIGFIVLFIYGGCLEYEGRALREVELAPIQAVPVCDKLGPYPYAGGLDMYVLVCPREEK